MADARRRARCADEGSHEIQVLPVLNWLKLRKQPEEVRSHAVRPFHVLQAHWPEVFPAIWKSHYCCTSAYFWTAVVIEEVCGNEPEFDPESKQRILREIFTELVETSGGNALEVMKRVLPDGHPMRRRALVDLKRVVDLMHGRYDDRYMIYPEYREAVYQDGRSAPRGNKYGLTTETAYEILYSRYLAANTEARENEEVPS
jgi:hypothetical protein